MCICVITEYIFVSQNVWSCISGQYIKSITDATAVLRLVSMATEYPVIL